VASRIVRYACALLAMYVEKKVVAGSSKADEFGTPRQADIIGTSIKRMCEAR